MQVKTKQLFLYFLINVKKSSGKAFPIKRRNFGGKKLNLSSQPKKFLPANSDFFLNHQN